jgi:hypothetical protein
VLLALSPRNQGSLPRDELLEMRRSPARRQGQSCLQRKVGLDHLIQEDGDGSRIGDNVMELQKDNVVVASAEQMHAAQRPFLDVERLVGLGMQRSRKFGVGQLGRIVLPQLVQFRRQQRRHGSDAVTREGKPQILVAQNETLHGLVEIVGIEMRPEREAGREPIGRIGRVETIDEPQRFLADRHVHSGTVDLDGIDGARPDIGIDRLDDRGGDRGNGRPLQEFADGKGDPQLDLDAILQLERGERIEPQLLQGALELDRRRLDLEHRRNLAPQIISDDVLPLPVRRGDDRRSHVLVGTTRAVQRDLGEARGSRRGGDEREGLRELRPIDLRKRHVRRSTA